GAAPCMSAATQIVGKGLWQRPAGKQGCLVDGPGKLPEVTPAPRLAGKSVPVDLVEMHTRYAGDVERLAQADAAADIVAVEYLSVDGVVRDPVRRGRNAQSGRH